MNDIANEQLSALMDGELPRDELRFLMRRIDSDASLAQRWSRYQVASMVLKRQYAGSLLVEGFAAGVIARLDTGAVPARRRLAGRLMRWAGGGAIAASVAVFALVATRPAGTDGAMAPAGGPTVAAIPALAMPQLSVPIAEMRQPLPPQQVLPAGFIDYAQPVPSYAPTLPGAPRDPNVQRGDGLTEGFVPYVLVVGSRQKAPEPQVPVRRRDAPTKQ